MNVCDVRLPKGLKIQKPYDLLEVINISLLLVVVYAKLVTDAMQLVPGP